MPSADVRTTLPLKMAYLPSLPCQPSSLKTTGSRSARTRGTAHPQDKQTPVHPPPWCAGSRPPSSQTLGLAAARADLAFLFQTRSGDHAHPATGSVRFPWGCVSPTRSTGGTDRQDTTPALWPMKQIKKTDTNSNNRTYFY